MTPALLWLEEQLAAQGTTADEMVRDEHQRQGASNVTVRNIITSMRLISDVDWPEFFEERQPGRCGAARRAAISPSMDFPTRDAVPARRSRNSRAARTSYGARNRAARRG